MKEKCKKNSNFFIVSIFDQEAAKSRRRLSDGRISLLEIEKVGMQL
jgi:hypothetical protein